jgi:mono/diheme cytochrome c family protein
MAESDREPRAAASSAEGLIYVGIGATVSFVLVLVLGLSIAAAGLTESKPGSGGSATGGPPDGAQIFDQHCATCHGANGEGKVGPALAGVAEKYAEIDTQIFLVEQGRGAMPSFRSTLSEEEIRAVVTFERETFLAAEAEVATGE